METYFTEYLALSISPPHQLLIPRAAKPEIYNIRILDSPAHSKGQLSHQNWMGGGGQTPFRDSLKIHPILRRHDSLS